MRIFAVSNDKGESIRLEAFYTSKAAAEEHIRRKKQINPVDWSDCSVVERELREQPDEVVEYFYAYYDDALDKVFYSWQYGEDGKPERAYGWVTEIPELLVDQWQGDDGVYRFKVTGRRDRDVLVAATILAEQWDAMKGGVL